MLVVLLFSGTGFCGWLENILLNCENIPPKFIGNEEFDEDVVVGDEVVEGEDTDEVEDVEDCENCPRNMF